MARTAEILDRVKRNEASNQWVTKVNRRLLNTERNYLNMLGYVSVYDARYGMTLITRAKSGAV